MSDSRYQTPEISNAVFSNAKFLAYLFLVSLVFTSCSVNNVNNEESRIKVTTSSAGNNRQLIQRIYFTDSEIDAVLRNWHPQVVMRYQVMREQDAYGHPIGLRIIACRPNCSSGKLGFKTGDVITAVGKKHITEINDLIFMFEDVKEKGMATLTLQRDFLPHKFYFHLSSKSSNSQVEKFK